MRKLIIILTLFILILTCGCAKSKNQGEIAPEAVVKMPTDNTLSELARKLAAYRTDFYTCHCTGLSQLAHMARFMPRLHAITTGDNLNL